MRAEDAATPKEDENGTDRYPEDAEDQINDGTGHHLDGGLCDRLTDSWKLEMSRRNSSEIVIYPG